MNHFEDEWDIFIGLFKPKKDDFLPKKYYVLLMVPGKTQIRGSLKW